MVQTTYIAVFASKAANQHRQPRPHPPLPFPQPGKALGTWLANYPRTIHFPPSGKVCMGKSVVEAFSYKLKVKVKKPHFMSVTRDSNNK